MKIVREVLQDADPLLHEPYALDTEREQLRRAVLQGGSEHSSSATSRPPALAVAITAVLAFGAFVALGLGLDELTEVVFAVVDIPGKAIVVTQQFYDELLGSHSGMGEPPRL